MAKELTIKKVNPNGSESVFSSFTVSEGTAAACYFPENKTADDITYNIYYDNGNGCTANDSIVVKSGTECQQTSPDDPGGGGETETCIINFKCNTSAPESVKVIISNHDVDTLFYIKKVDDSN